MKLLFAALSLLLTLALICSPLYLVYIGFVGPNVSFWVRVVLVVIGLVLCRLVKPISIITGKGLEDILESNPTYFLFQLLLVTVDNVVSNIDT